MEVTFKNSGLSGCFVYSMLSERVEQCLSFLEITFFVSTLDDLFTTVKQFMANLVL